MDQIKKKVHGLVTLFPTNKGVRIVVALQDNVGNRTETLSLTVTGAGIIGNELLLQVQNGEVQEKRFPLDNIFDLMIPDHFVTLDLN